MDLCSSFIFVCRESILYILMDIKLPLLPLTILYLHVSYFSLLFVLGFVIITDLMLWILKAFDLNT